MALVAGHPARRLRTVGYQLAQQPQGQLRMGAEIRGLRRHAAAPAPLRIGLVPVLSDLENRQTSNWYWIGELESKFLLGDRDLDLVDRRQEYIDAVTAEQIAAVAELVLKPESLVELIQVPEASEE